RSLEAHQHAVARRVRAPARRGDGRAGARRAVLGHDGARLPHRHRSGRPLPVRAEGVRAGRRGVRHVRQETRHHAHDRSAGDDVLPAVPALTTLLLHGHRQRARSRGPIAELAGVVASPAIRRATGRQAAGVPQSGADADELEVICDGGGIGPSGAGAVAQLPVGVVAPAVRRSARDHTAAVPTAPVQDREREPSRDRDRAPALALLKASPPTTATGVADAPPVPPSPSWPAKLSPQQYAAPDVVTPQVCAPPAPTIVKARSPATRAGLVWGMPIPSPSWP